MKNWVVGALAVAVIYGVIQSDNEERARESLEAQKTPEQRRVEAADMAKKDADFAFAVAATKAVKQTLKNPASFEIASAGLVDGGALCLEYRATNSFNATITEHIAVTRKGAQGIWNKDCVGKNLMNMSHIKYAL